LWEKKKAHRNGYAPLSDKGIVIADLIRNPLAIFVIASLRSNVPKQNQSTCQNKIDQCVAFRREAMCRFPQGNNPDS
jgi:hypothetical protein